MLEVRIDRKRFGASTGDNRTVLRDVVFSLAKGEVVALLGPSGTGKSTTLRIVLGLDTDYDGHVCGPGGRVGAMFQEPRLLQWLTVRENLELVVQAGMPTCDIERLLETVQLSRTAGLYPRQLSLGMARRVALARALAVSPDLLVLDEPFASLDPKLGAGLAAMVRDHARDGGAGVLLATHDLAQAMDLASRVLILSGAPATLAADVAVPHPQDGIARAKVQADLFARFAFLRLRDDQPDDMDRLPSPPSAA